MLPLLSILVLFILLFNFKYFMVLNGLNISALVLSQQVCPENCMAAWFISNAIFRVCHAPIFKSPGEDSSRMRKLIIFIEFNENLSKIMQLSSMIKYRKLQWLLSERGTKNLIKYPKLSLLPKKPIISLYLFLPKSLSQLHQSLGALQANACT